MAKVRKNIRNAAAAQMSLVQRCDAALEALEFVTHTLNADRHGPLHDDIERARALLRGQLYTKKSHAQEAAMMFANLSEDPELATESTKLAARFIARQNAAIMQYLDPSGIAPSRYLASEHEEFRAEIDSAIAELNDTPTPEQDN